MDFYLPGRNGNRKDRTSGLIIRNGDLAAMGSDDGLAQADVKFHDVIYEATHNRRLVQLLNNIREQIYRYRMEYLKDAASRKLLDEEHKAICRAIREKDIQKAHEYICQHIDNQQRSIVKSISEM